MWSLISPRAKRVSGPGEFWSSSQKDFFNTIGAKQTSTGQDDTTLSTRNGHQDFANKQLEASPYQCTQLT
jgi:hypothetical protein